MRSRLGVRPVPLYIGLLTNCIYVIFWLLISLVRIHIPLWRVANGPLFFKKGRGVVRMTSPCCYWWEPWSLAADLTLDTKQEGHTVRGKQPKIRQLRHNKSENSAFQQAQRICKARNSGYICVPKADGDQQLLKISISIK